jgi:hypothetical protein
VGAFWRHWMVGGIIAGAHVGGKKKSYGKVGGRKDSGVRLGLFITTHSPGNCLVWHGILPFWFAFPQRDYWVVTYSLYKFLSDIWFAKFFPVLCLSLSWWSPWKHKTLYLDETSHSFLILWIPLWILSTNSAQHNVTRHFSYILFNYLLTYFFLFFLKQSLSM